MPSTVPRLQRKSFNRVLDSAKTDTSRRKQTGADENGSLCRRLRLDICHLDMSKYSRGYPGCKDVVSIGSQEEEGDICKSQYGAWTAA